jgi:Uma2 family endonuclease
MTIQAAKKFWTDDELIAMPHDGRKREIIDGELVVMSPASFNHGKIISRLSFALGEYIYPRQLGELADGQTGFRLKSDDLFSPDIAFVSTAGASAHQQRGDVFFHGAPELLVEVLSPSDTVEVLEEKLAQFFREGLRCAWVVHPKTRTVHVYRSLTSIAILTSQDSLDGEDVIPGFRYEISKLFA